MELFAFGLYMVYFVTNHSDHYLVSTTRSTTTAHPAPLRGLKRAISRAFVERMVAGTVDEAYHSREAIQRD